MFLEHALLQNYVGLHEGTGREIIEVDFRAMRDSGLKRCMFLGRNGSGKSTLLNAISSPFPTQGDGRSIVIIKDKPGRKVLRYNNDGQIITCDIRWSPKGKVSGFIFLNDSDKPTPDTEKGNITEYIRAVETYLGVTVDYLDIGRVGNRIGGFIDLGPTDRKKFIGNFMPEIEEWSIMHKNASKRLSAFKAQLSGMQVELERIEPREVLENALNISKNLGLQISENLRNIDTNIGATTSSIEKIQPLIKSQLVALGYGEDLSILNEIDDRIEKVSSDVLRSDNALNRIIEARPNLKIFVDIEVAKAKLAELEAMTTRATAERDMLYPQRSALSGRFEKLLSDKKTADISIEKINSSNDQIERLQAQMATLTAEIQELEALNSENSSTVTDDITYEEAKTVSDYMMQLEGKVNDIRGMFPTVEFIDYAISINMDVDIYSMSVSNHINTRDDLKRQLEISTSRMSTLESQSSLFKRFKNMKCTSSNCPYHSHISQYQPSDAEVEERRSGIESLKNRIEDLDERIGVAASVKNGMKMATAAITELRKHKRVLEQAGVWDRVGSSEKFMTLIASRQTEIDEVLAVTKFCQILDYRRKLTEKSRQYTEVKERIVNLKSLKEAEDQIIKNRQNILIAIEELTEERQKLDSQIEERDQAIRLQNAGITAVKSVYDEQVKRVKLNDELTVLNVVKASTMTLQSELATSELRLIDLNNERKELEKTLKANDQSLNENRQKLMRREEYENRLAEMNGKIIKISTIVEACNPTKGAPIEFVREFLESTQNEVNNLLDVAMKGEMRIGFKLSEKEFSIPISKASGRVIPDINEASEGQVSLTKTIICMALIKQLLVTTNGFNIVSLDEVDGTLDKEKNRERFAEIVDRLIFELGLEQLFLISHNDNFYAAPAALVLLPGHAMSLQDQSFMSNKIVISDFS